MKNQCYCPLRISVQMICMGKLMQSSVNMMFESVLECLLYTLCMSLLSYPLFSVDRTWVMYVRLTSFFLFSYCGTHPSKQLSLVEVEPRGFHLRQLYSVVHCLQQQRLVVFYPLPFLDQGKVKGNPLITR